MVSDYFVGPQIVNLLAVFTDPSLNAVTNPKDVSMFTERIAESLENMALAISLTWTREVIVFILFFVFFVSGLIPSDVQTQNYPPACVKLKCVFCPAAFLSRCSCAA